VSLHSLLLGSEVTEVLSHVSVGVGLTVDVLSYREQMIFLFFDMNIVSSDCTSKINVSSLSIFDVFSKIIAILRNSVNISSKGNTLDVLLGVKVLDSGKLPFVIIKSDSFLSKFVRS